VTAPEVRRLGTHSLSFPLEALSDEYLEQGARRAGDWMLTVLAKHEVLLDREHRMRIFRAAVEESMTGAEDKRS
jgi:hypothetical protein